MRQALHRIEQRTRGQGFYELTGPISAWVEKQRFATGLLTVFCRHTSASLLIQENADPDVRTDMLGFLDQIAPEGSHYIHSDEGPDDMPAHLKSLLTQTSLSIPLDRSRLVLGTWQGIYLVEHRAQPYRRELVLHLLGERARALQPRLMFTICSLRRSSMSSKTLYFVQPYLMKHNKLVASGALTFRDCEDAIEAGGALARRRAGVVVLAQSYDPVQRVMTRPTVLHIHGRVPDGWLVDRMAA